MEFTSVGKNIRRFRLLRKLRQADLAEKVGLSTNYVGSLERGEKIPALDTFIAIANVLEVSSDMLLCDVLTTGYAVKNSLLNEKLEKLSADDRNKIYDVIDAMMRHSTQVKP